MILKLPVQVIFELSRHHVISGRIFRLVF